MYLLASEAQLILILHAFMLPVGYSCIPSIAACLAVSRDRHMKATTLTVMGGRFTAGVAA